MPADSAVVAERFSAAASSYDAAARVQAAAAAALAERLPPGPAPGAILDLGCGTGLLAAELRRRYPDAALTGLDVAEGMVARCQADWAADPDSGFWLEDFQETAPPEAPALVASSFAFQWLADGPGELGRWAAALAPGSVLALAVPVAGSLAGLARHYHTATGRPFPGLAYPEPAAYRAAALAGGLTVLTEETGELALPGGAPLAALRSLKQLGATATAAPAGPASAGALRRALRRAGEAGEQPGFTVLYLVARKEGP